VFFNGKIAKRIVNGHVVGDRCKLFIHPCSNPQYRLPIFPDKEQLHDLRLPNGNNEPAVTCNHCMQKWSFNNLDESYLRDFVKIPYYTTLLDENKARRL
jgi:hypothetical protein